MVFTMASLGRLKYVVITAVIGLVVASVIFAAIIVISSSSQPKTIVRVGDAVVTATIAQTPASRTQGLSGTTQLGAGEALLMVFPNDGIWKIWMKDMNYPIDILWLDADKKIIYIVKNAPPEAGTSVVYEPESPARYIVELSAGTVDRAVVAIGQTTMFEFDESKVK